MQCWKAKRLGRPQGLASQMSHIEKGFSFCAFGFKMKKRAAHMTASPLTQNGLTPVMQEMTMKQAELEKVHVEIIKLLAEQRNLNAEAGKLSAEAAK